MSDKVRVIAVDFDGTLFSCAWPDIGEPIWPVINAAKREQREGASLILWSTREGESLQRAVEACRSVGLHFDAVNQNAPVMVELWHNNPRKVGATEYWDDRGVSEADIVRREKERDIISPTADVAPVVHGRWVYKGTSVDGKRMFECSACHANIAATGPYCKECGALMDGKDEDNG